MKEADISFENVTKAQNILRILKHPLRQKILLYILNNPDTIVTDIYTHFELDQSAASSHLSDLRKAGAVYTTRIHRNIHYRINNKSINEINRLSGLINEIAGDK